MVPDIARSLTATWYGSKRRWKPIAIMRLPTLTFAAITRNAYQRLYDMILSHATEEVYENKEKITRFKFFTAFKKRGVLLKLDPLPELPLHHRDRD